MQRRFDADPAFRATELLLQERVPRAPAIYPHPAEVSRRARHAGRRRARTAASSPRRARRRPRCTCSPTAATTSRSPTRAAATAAGATSRSRAGARTRRATAGARSATCATSTTGEFWSAAHQPTLRAGDQLRGDLLAGPRRVPPPRRRHRDARRDQRLARGRHRAAPGQPHQPRARRARTIELTSYAEVVLAHAGGRRGAPGVQQPVRADRARPRAPGDPLHAPAALGRRAAAVDAAPDDGARHRRRATTSYETGARRVHRPRPLGRRSGGDAPRRARRQRGLGARSGRRDPQHAS